MQKSRDSKSFLVTLGMLIAFSACSPENTKQANETGDSYDPFSQIGLPIGNPSDVSQETTDAIFESYKTKLADLSDYERALVGCGALVWTGWDFAIPSSVGGNRSNLNNDCPSKTDFE